MKLLEWLTGKRSAKRDFEDFIGELEVHLREVDRLLAELERRRLELEDGRWVYTTRWHKVQSHLFSFHESSQEPFESYRMILRRLHFGEEQADIETMTFPRNGNLETCQRYLQGCRREWELFLREFSGIDLSRDELKHSYFRDLLAMENHVWDMEHWDRDFRDEQTSLEALQSEIEKYQRKREQLLVFYEEKKREYEAQMLVKTVDALTETMEVESKKSR